MADCDNDARLQRFAGDLRDQPVPLGDDSRARVLAALRAAADRGAESDPAGAAVPDADAHPAPRPGVRSARPWLLRRSFTLSPLAGALLAASLVGVGVVLGGRGMRDAGRGMNGAEPTPMADVQPASRIPRPASRPVQFVLVAPRASSVELVGDFNDWRALPMRAAEQGGVWTVTVPLAPGRHTYSFVVDGTTWTADPSAPLAPEDGFGTRNSVVMVGESST